MLGPVLADRKVLAQLRSVSVGEVPRVTEPKLEQVLGRTLFREHCGAEFTEGVKPDLLTCVVENPSGSLVAGHSISGWLCPSSQVTDSLQIR